MPAVRARSPRHADRHRAVLDAGQAALQRDRFQCQAVGLHPHRCEGRLDPQHVIPRSVRRDLAAEVDNIVAVCRAAHRWIDANPEAAWALGLHGYSWDDIGDAAARRQQARAQAGGIPWPR